MKLIKIYAIFFRNQKSPKDYAKRAKKALGYSEDAFVVGTPASAETFATRVVKEVCGDISAMNPVPDLKMEEGNYKDFSKQFNQGVDGGGMNSYSINFLKRKIAEAHDPDYFNIPGYTVNVTASIDKLSDNGVVIIMIYI